MASMMKMRDIKAAKANVGKDTVQGTDENMLMKNKGSYKTTASGHESDSGSKGAALCEASESMYRKAVENKPDTMGDQGLKDR